MIQHLEYFLVSLCLWIVLFFLLLVNINEKLVDSLPLFLVANVVLHSGRYLAEPRCAHCYTVLCNEGRSVEVSIVEEGVLTLVQDSPRQIVFGGDIPRPHINLSFEEILLGLRARYSRKVVVVLLCSSDWRIFRFKVKT
jgi:hypothetical protein